MPDQLKENGCPTERMQPSPWMPGDGGEAVMPSRRTASRWLNLSREAVRRERFWMRLTFGAAWATGWGAGDEDGVEGEGAGIGYGGRLTRTRGSLRAGGRMHPNEHCGAFPGGPEPRPGRERRRDGPGACRSDRRDGQFLAGNVSFRVPTPVRRRTAMSEFVSHVWK